MLVAEEHGGAGLGMGAYCALAEELGAALAPEPLIGASVAASVLRGDALSRLLDGSALVLPAWQERANRFDVGTETTIAGGLVTGTKVFVAGAGGADGFVVAAGDGLGPGDGEGGHGVGGNLPGVGVGALWAG